MSKRNNQKKHNANKDKEIKMQILIAYYKSNPDIFMERELGVSLTKWQRFILKRMRFK